MLRMPRIQPLIEEMRMVSAGRMLWLTALPMKYWSHAGTRPGVNPPEDGNQLSGPASSAIATRPSQKYGTDDRNVVAGSRLSIHVPRRQPAPMPSAVPMRKLRIVVMPTSPIVQGRLWPITSETEEGKNVNDRP